jgi:hypothetical protein
MKNSVTFALHKKIMAEKDSKTVRWGYLIPLIDKAVEKINATGNDKVDFSKYVRRAVVAMLKKDRIIK